MDTRDLADVVAMRERQLIRAEEVRSQFACMASNLYRFPAIDPAAFRRALDDLFPPAAP